jgi:mannose-6-phosphate isomerase-like protein (cupin superfamily)
MQIFDLDKMQSFPYEERDKNVFYSTKEFKVRIIKLLSNEQIPKCEMDSFVIYYVLEGKAELSVNEERADIEAGMCIIIEPGTFSLKTKEGVKIMGIQIKKQA